MDTSYKKLEFLLKKIEDLADDKDLLTFQLQASRNTSKNLDDECKDLVKEVNSLRKALSIEQEQHNRTVKLAMDRKGQIDNLIFVVKELKTSLSQQHELRYYTSENTDLQSRKEIQAYKQYLVAITAYNNYNGITDKIKNIR